MSAFGLARGHAAGVSRRGTGVSPRAAALPRAATDWDAGLLAIDRGYLTTGELLEGLDRWEQLGRSPPLMDTLVEQGLLLGWQRREVQDLLEQVGTPPIPWEELGAGD